MSSTLFGRGINTQTGGSRRAMQLDRDVELLKQNVATLSVGLSAVSELRQANADLTTKVTSLEAKIARLDATIANPSSKPLSVPPSTEPRSAVVRPVESLQSDA